MELSRTWLCMLIILLSLIEYVTEALWHSSPQAWEQTEGQWEGVLYRDTSSVGKRSQTGPTVISSLHNFMSHLWNENNGVCPWEGWLSTVWTLAPPLHISATCSPWAEIIAPSIALLLCSEWSGGKRYYRPNVQSSFLLISKEELCSRCVFVSGT